MPITLPFLSILGSVPSSSGYNSQYYVAMRCSAACQTNCETGLYRGERVTEGTGSHRGGAENVEKQSIFQYLLSVSGSR